MPQPNAPPGIGWKALGLLQIPAKTALVFLRWDFGVRAITPATLIVVPLVYIPLYAVIDSLEQWGRPFTHSLSWPFIVAFEIAGVGQMAFAWWRYWQNRPQLTVYLGTPLLMRLGVPFRLAWLLDIGIALGVGMLVRGADPILGAWLMWGAVGMTITFVSGVQMQFRDRMDMIDSQIYSGVVIRDVKQKTKPQPRAATPEQDLSTGV